MIKEHYYNSPSAMHLNIKSLRKFYALQGPWSKRKNKLCNLADDLQFEITYGYNPRCHHKGTWGKPGTFFWRIDR